MDQQFAQNVFNNFNELFIKPEIARRKSIGRLTDDFKIQKVLVLISISEKPVIQLNEEVEAEAIAKIKPGIVKQKGEDLYLDDIESIEKIILPEKYINSGYIFIIALNGRYSIIFDFLYNKDIRKKHYKRALDFLETAENALAVSKYSVFVDTLYSATELISRMFLLSQPDKKFLNKSTHRAIQIKMNQHSKLNENTREITNLLNVLLGLRHEARYSNDDYEIKKEDGIAMLNTLKGFISNLPKNFA